MVKVIIHDRVVELTTREATGLMRRIFEQVKVPDVAETLDRMNKAATADQIRRIAGNLFDAIFEHDEEYWELEDKNILYLAEQMEVKDAWETA